nr:hypothetical protein [Nocardioides acrostichi]
MSVPPGAVAGDAPTSEDVLYLLPQDLVDDRLVRAVVDHAVEDDLTLVVRVAQHPMDLARVDRLPDDLSRRAALEAALLECVAQPGD